MAVGEERIADMEDYNRAMSKSMIDKMFFMDKIDESVTAVLDYGCADGVLKYRYADNWEREVRENYLPVSVEDIVNRIAAGPLKYQLIYFDHYILPFISRSVKRDFDIILKDYTHVKFIYELQ